jgi:hypothetical protein
LRRGDATPVVAWPEQPWRVSSERPRVCFSGSRTFSDLDAVREAVAGLDPRSVVVHGGARGVDQAAAEAAAARNLAVEAWRADWRRFRKGAGPLRKRAMLATCDALYAFWVLSDRKN